MKGWLAGLLLACLVMGCSDPDAGPPLGDFPAITKTETDASFALTAPSSRSPAAFKFTSSDAKVATIEGATVTIHGAGTSTITASQPSLGTYGPTSKSTTLTVTAVACENGGVRIDGICKTTPNCVSPATEVNRECIAPVSSATTVNVPGQIWIGVTVADTFAHARDYCAGTVINSIAGWRQPTSVELRNLVAAGAIAGNNWVTGEAWSKDAGAAGSHVVVNLANGATAERPDTAAAYVSCMRSAP